MSNIPAFNANSKFAQLRYLGISLSKDASKMIFRKSMKIRLYVSRCLFLSVQFREKLDPTRNTYSKQF